MSLNRIRDLLVVNISEMYESEEEILRLLPLMSARAVTPGLRDLLDAHYRETQQHVARLTAAFNLLDERRRPTPAAAIRGLAEEARIREALIEGGDMLDLALLDTARRVEHYEIAAYSTTLAYARRLNQGEIVGLLTATLEDERRADSRLEMLAVPARVHAA